MSPLQEHKKELWNPLEIELLELEESHPLAQDYSRLKSALLELNSSYSELNQLIKLALFETTIYDQTFSYSLTDLLIQDGKSHLIPKIQENLQEVLEEYGLGHIQRTNTNSNVIEYNKLAGEYQQFKGIVNGIKETTEFVEAYGETETEEVRNMINRDLKGVTSFLMNQRMTGEHDMNNAYLTLFFVQKNEDSFNGDSDGVIYRNKLLEAYVAYAERIGYKVNIIDDIAESTSRTIEIKGEGAYFRFKGEEGNHRFIFKKDKILNSNIKVLVTPVVQEEEFELNNLNTRINDVSAPGPGGSGKDTANSAVQVVYSDSASDIPSISTTIYRRGEGMSRDDKIDLAMKILRSKIVDYLETVADKPKFTLLNQNRRTYHMDNHRISDVPTDVKMQNGDFDSFFTGNMKPFMLANHGLYFE